jgi:hypothetical protein
MDIRIRGLRRRPSAPNSNRRKNPNPRRSEMRTFLRCLEGVALLPVAVSAEELEVLDGCGAA